MSKGRDIEISHEKDEEIYARSNMRREDFQVSRSERVVEVTCLERTKKG